MAKTSIKTLLKAGKPIFGSTVQTGSPEAVEIVGKAGFDFVMIDTEHGTIDLGLLVHMLRAADSVGLASVVRVPDSNASHILRVLDAGASGILVPHLRNRAETEAIVRAMKFGPEGTRGACPYTRATGHLADDWPAFARQANDEIVLWGIVEDLEGVDNIDEIVDVPGLDAIFPGPFDLSQALGFAGDFYAPEVQTLLKKIVDAADCAGQHVMMIPSWMAAGHSSTATKPRIFLEGVDRAVLSTGMRELRRKLKDEFER